jgi:endonuclease/exonuclease/phosphatase family metal-dependent hydrolase
MTYNVHGGFGADFRLDLMRIARVIESQRVDLCALQELDVERPRSGGHDQPRWLAEQLGMQLQFCSARDCDGGRYGNAVLSRHPIESVRTLCLPRRHDDREPRALQWVRMHTASGPLNLLNTHLGLDRRERLIQAAAILGRDWVDDACATGATVLCGDFNARPRSLVYRMLTERLRDAQLVVPHERTPLSTFPSLFPLLRIDHVLVSPDVEVRACSVVRGGLARLASDHLPLIADIELKERSTWAAS